MLKPARFTETSVIKYADTCYYIYEKISQTLCGNMGRIDMNTIKTLKKCNYIKKKYMTTGNRLQLTKKKGRNKTTHTNIISI
jgi:ribosomal protein S4E